MSSGARDENRAARLAFPPSYVVVGIYRLVTDKSLSMSVWEKCRHGLQRGGVVSLIWALITYKIQKTFVEYFLHNSPRVAGLSHDTLFGYRLPISITTYATVLFITSQMEVILWFFLAKNIRVAHEHVWELTVKSRGKGQGFWQPYIEEWQRPPTVARTNWQEDIKYWFISFFVQRVLWIPLNFYPIIGLLIGAWFKGLRTACYLHKPYFTAKKMDDCQVAVFMEERKWDYRSFGFAAALIESVPLLGLLFSISNRIGAAMWAHDLEKRQHMFRGGELQPSPPLEYPLPKN